MHLHRMALCVALLSAAIGWSCIASTDGSPHTDASTHDVEVPDATSPCTEGELWCEGSVLYGCVGGYFHVIKPCQQGCVPGLGCNEDLLPPDGPSHIWISNTADGTLSKIDTSTAAEEARYQTCPLGDQCDPSRTAVNLYGDMVVTNRMVAPSSVTKFAADVDDCIDRNANGTIDTSTGPGDIKPWGEDECMIWHTELPNASDFALGNQGARATAWDGQANLDTGLGGSVWVGTCSAGLGGENRVHRINGDTGTLEETLMLPDIDCAYGGAMDGNGAFWIFDYLLVLLVRVDTANLTTESIPVQCGYGITVDALGRIWTGGHSCISRYHYPTDTEDVLDSADFTYLRGIAVGIGKSDGYVWSVDTPGNLHKVDANTMELIDSYSFGTDIHMIGVAADYEGYIWTVAMYENAAYKFDPETETYETITIGDSPYTYSDMTGIQLRNVTVQ